ncbi:MAG: penicillin-binding transpeptidase domain-containing protein [Verrucomicrobiales bacterium]
MDCLAQDYTRPLIGRYHTLHTPGSAFNPVAALSAFHAGFVEKNYTCTGMVTLVKRPIRCWVSTNGEQHGELGLSEALACSCNAYFYRMAADLPPDAFLRGGEMLGIAGDRFRPVGIGNERVAAIPNPAWKLKYTNQPWSKDDAANVSIGQLATEVSPIQMAGVTASLANGASIIQPWLIAGDRPEPQGFVDYGIGEAQVGAIREGMWRVVNGEDGTGRRARSEIIAIAGKSGTAQRGRWDDRIKENVRDYNAWFIGFAPYDAPKYAICVMVENGKSGGSVAAPIARRILEQITQVESGAIEVKVGALPPAAGHFDFVEAVEF